MSFLIAVITIREIIYFNRSSRMARQAALVAKAELKKVFDPEDPDFKLMFRRPLYHESDKERKGGALIYLWCVAAYSFVHFIRAEAKPLAGPASAGSVGKMFVWLNHPLFVVCSTGETHQL